MYELLGEPQLSVEIKKSRFIATCVHVDTPEAALEAVKRLECPDATHNCWAYRIGGAYRFNDDGEPGGSAGRPILAAIDGQEFDNVLAHVVRYFGGIKLGVGGLVRAYGNTVAECLRTAEKKLRVMRTELAFSVDFSDTHAVYGIITQRKLIKESENYTPNGVDFRLSLEADLEDEIRTRLTDATRARIKWADENK